MKSALRWIMDNSESLSIRGINKQVGMPEDTLIKAVNQSQMLPKKWRQPLETFINNLKK